MAEQVWQGRERLLPELTPLSDCIEIAVALGNDPAKPPVVIADVADNPGGGGRGNTAWLLKGLYEASAKDAIIGVFFDAPLAAESHGMRVGDTFQATFNRAEDDQYSESFTAEAEILHLSDGRIVGRDPGSRAGMTINLGPTAVLRVGTVRVVVISIRQQCIDLRISRNSA